MEKVAESSFDFLVAEILNEITDPSVLEQIGARIGHCLAEKLAKKERFLDNLDVIKFICKDFWIAVFQKQVDNLKTNHRVNRSLNREFM
jgi:hypothetical protein